MTQLPTSYTGSCLCGAVTFTISAAPNFRCLCYCTTCKKASGSAFMHNWGFPEESLTIVTGSDEIRTFDDAHTASGTPLQRSFCIQCGSPVAIRSQRPGAEGRVMIPAGLLDGDHLQDFVPEAEFYAYKRPAWMTAVANQS